jgi:hypothetical protein
MDEMIIKIRNSKFISFAIDEACDVGKKDNLYFVIRYIFNNQINENFLKLFEPHDKKEISIFNAVKDFLNKEGLANKVVSVSTDGAANMFGDEKGFQGQFLKAYKNTIFLIALPINHILV